MAPRHDKVLGKLLLDIVPKKDRAFCCYEFFVMTYQFGQALYKPGTFPGTRHSGSRAASSKGNWQARIPEELNRNGLERVQCTSQLD